MCGIASKVEWRIGPNFHRLRVINYPFEKVFSLETGPKWVLLRFPDGNFELVLINEEGILI